MTSTLGLRKYPKTKAMISTGSKKLSAFAKV
jgi:hypothetical protein